MKKIIRLIGMIVLLVIYNQLAAQTVAVTDKSGGITPANLLQVHKTGTAASTLIQMSNDNTGAAATDGIQLGIDASDNGFIINKESGKTIIIGTATDNTSYETDGTEVFNGNATVWDDLRIAINLRTVAGVPPTLSLFAGSANLYVYAFNGTSGTDNIYFEAELPHSWKEGSTIYPHAHWTPSDNSSGNVKWILEYEWKDIGGTYNSTTTTVSGTQAAGGTAWVSNKTDVPSGGISGTGHTISSTLICHLYRDADDAADTYSHDAFLTGFDFHYEINTIGSRTTLIK